MLKGHLNKYDFTFLIVNFNGQKTGLLVDCLQSINDFVKNKSQIIVVDNKSTDDSVIYINNLKKRSIHDFCILTLDQNYGPSFARYKALSMIEGFITVILDNDAQLTINSLNNVLDEYLSDSNLAILQPLLLIKSNGLVDYAGDFMTRIGILTQNVEPLTKPTDISKEKFNCYILSAKSAGMFIRTSALIEVGGFDPWFYMYVEETDLGWRCWNSGYTNKSILDNIILHAYGSSALSTGPKVVNFNSAFYGTRNYLATIYLNEFGFSMFFTFFCCLFCWIIFNLSCLFRGEFYRFKYSIYGILCFFISYPDLRRKKISRVIPSKIEKKFINSRIYKPVPILDFYKKFVRRPVIGNSVKWK